MKVIVQPGILVKSNQISIYLNTSSNSPLGLGNTAPYPPSLGATACELWASLMRAPPMAPVWSATFPSPAVWVPWKWSLNMFFSLLKFFSFQDSWGIGNKKFECLCDCVWNYIIWCIFWGLLDCDFSYEIICFYLYDLKFMWYFERYAFLMCAFCRYCKCEFLCEQTCVRSCMTLSWICVILIIWL